MTDPRHGKDAEIARLLSKLADLSGEAETLDAYRREAEAFDPIASTKSISSALDALENEGKPP